MKRFSSLFVGLLVLVILAANFSAVRSLAQSRLRSRRTVEDRVVQYGSDARLRLAPYFSKAKVEYPPAAITFVGLKQEGLLEVYAGTSHDQSRFIRSYPVLAASGTLGPKLRQGDLQVPEGLYRITFLNPNSRFHLSLRIGYPNQFDRAQARKEGRTNLGGDIMIHGNQVSIGCLAMGDSAAEELFTLGADVGIGKIRVVLSPVDFRSTALPADYAAALQPWVSSLYRDILAALKQLPGQKPR